MVTLVTNISCITYVLPLGPNADQGQLDEAAEHCDKVLHSAPRNARAHFLRGAVEQRAGRLQEAAKYACKAAQLRPDLSGPQLAAGSLLIRNKLYTDALAHFEAAIEMDPSNARYHVGGRLTC